LMKSECFLTASITCKEIKLVSTDFNCLYCIKRIRNLNKNIQKQISNLNKILRMMNIFQKQIGNLSKNFKNKFESEIKNSKTNSKSEQKSTKTNLDFFWKSWIFFQKQIRNLTRTSKKFETEIKKSKTNLKSKQKNSKRNLKSEQNFENHEYFLKNKFEILQELQKQIWIWTKKIKNKFEI
jgi:hypothetical protein